MSRNILRATTRRRPPPGARYGRPVRLATPFALALLAALAPAASGAADLRVVTPREHVPVVFGTPRIELRVPPASDLDVRLNGREVTSRLTVRGTTATGRVGAADGLRLGRNRLVVRATAEGGAARRLTRTFYGVRRDPTMVTILRPRAGTTLLRRPVRIAFRTGTPIVILRAWVNGREVTGRLSASRRVGRTEQALRTATVPAAFLRAGGNVLKVRAIGTRGRYETAFRPFRVRARGVAAAP